MLDKAMSWTAMTYIENRRRRALRMNPAVLQHLEGGKRGKEREEA